MLVRSRALGPMVTRLSVSMTAERLCWMNAGPCGCSGGTDENCPGRDLGQFFWSACTTLMSPSKNVTFFPRYIWQKLSVNLLHKFQSQVYARIPPLKRCPLAVKNLRGFGAG